MVNNLLYLPRIGKYIRKNEIIPSAVPTLLMACVTALLLPNTKVVTRAKATNMTVPIIEINKGVVPGLARLKRY